MLVTQIGHDIECQVEVTDPSFYGTRCCMPRFREISKVTEVIKNQQGGFTATKGITADGKELELSCYSADGADMGLCQCVAHPIWQYR